MHEGLQKHVQILQRLGVQGMSSDESDHEVVASHPPAWRTNPRYLVRSPAWRAAHLTLWLRTFDAGHMIKCRMVEGGSRGAFPRLHVYNGQPSNVSKKTFIRDAYDPQWLAHRKDVQFCVTLDKQPYDFSHDLNILESVIRVWISWSYFLIHLSVKFTQALQIALELSQNKCRPASVRLSTISFRMCIAFFFDALIMTSSLLYKTIGPLH